MPTGTIITLSITSLSVIMSLVVIAGILASQIQQHRKLNTLIIISLACNALIMCLDDASWLLEGHKGVTIGYVLMMLDYGSYVFNYLLAALFNHYVCTYILRKGDLTLLSGRTKPLNKSIYKYLINLGYRLFAVSTVILLIFQLNNTLTYFDSANIYQHTDIFWLAYILPFSFVLVDALLILQSKDRLGKATTYILMFYALLPLISLIVQVLINGNIVILNVAVTVAFIVIFGRVQIEEIKDMAYVDNVTRLANQTLFNLHLDNAIKKSNENFLLVAFKTPSLTSVISYFGYDYYDDLIRQLSSRLLDELSSTDILARFYAGTFNMLIENVNSCEEAELIVKSIMKLSKIPFILDGQEFFITVSVGACMYPADGTNSKQLTQYLGIALDEATKLGKNNYVFFNQSMKAKAEERVLLTNHLNKALDKNELQIYYQPKVDTKTLKISGAEALMRWISPELGFVSPLKFISIAEETGLINEMGEWALETVCKQNKAWQEMNLPAISVAVNVSAFQLINKNFADIVERVLNETGIDPKYLELEITEQFAEVEESQVIETLTRIKQLGIAISIDDFGTANSTLTRLNTMPFDKLKIDKQFVDGIGMDTKDAKIISSIFDLAKNLELDVIAEGVETEEQVNFLNQFNCNQIQGYYYYKPMPVSDFEKVLREVKQ